MMAWLISDSPVGLHFHHALFILQILPFGLRFRQVRKRKVGDLDLIAF
jgi:hypothetical protein